MTTKSDLDPPLYRADSKDKYTCYKMASIVDCQPPPSEFSVEPILLD